MKSKTRADINRQARLKESLANEKRMQEEKALFKQINKYVFPLCLTPYRLKDISKQLTEKQQADLKRLEERKAAMELAANTQTKKLSRHTYTLLVVNPQVPTHPHPHKIGGRNGRCPHQAETRGEPDSGPVREFPGPEYD